MNKIRSVKRTDKDFIIFESGETERHICNLYYGQMVKKYNGYHYYSKDMPEDYFSKAERLLKAGWGSGYWYDNWFRPGESWNENGGISTDDAIKELEEIN